MRFDRVGSFFSAFRTSSEGKQTKEQAAGLKEGLPIGEEGDSRSLNLRLQLLLTKVGGQADVDQRTIVYPMYHIPKEQSMVLYAT